MSTTASSSSNTQTSSCPICNREVSGNISLHVDRCLRRAPSSSRRVYNDPEEEENEWNVKSEYEKEGGEESSDRDYSDNNSESQILDEIHDNNENADVTNTLKRRSVGSSHRSKKQKKDQPFQVLVDDWEDVVYRRRIANVSIESTTTEYGAVVATETFEKLFEYQREGLKWLYLLFKRDAGGILGDEMGLGKTIQLCCHLNSIVLSDNGPYADQEKAFLIVCPATLLHHWLRELHIWAPFIRTVLMHTMSQTFNELTHLKNHSYILKGLLKLKRESHRGLVVLMTYEGVRTNMKALSSIEWTCICLDEGQKIRNPEAEITIDCKSLRGNHRIILSGTPIQNSLRELWSLVDFVSPGKLGALPIFEIEISKPIREGGYRNANQFQAELGVRTAMALQELIKPHLLRRKKDDLKDVTKLTAKTEKVLFCSLTEKQRGLYLEVINSSLVKSILKRNITNAFQALSLLRKICNHPDLVTEDGIMKWKEEKNKISRVELNRVEDISDEEDESEVIRVDDIKWEDSGKLLILSKLLEIWKRDGDKVLIFSQSKCMLDIVECLLRQRVYSYCRLDGSTPVSKRNRFISSFNEDESIFVMILTTKTGGLGISLTAANRVVLMDPCWNPQTDCQARERSWRIGQKRDVSIYRLITKGAIEEKIYERQIFKLLLSNRILQNAKQKALFTPSSMRDLFELKDFDDGELPSAGEITEREVSVSSSSSSSSSGLVDDSVSRDNRVLKALFDGTSLCAVYDHNFLETHIMTSIINEATRTSKEIIEKAKNRLSESARQLPPRPSQSVQFDILQRVKDIFENRKVMSSQEVISAFGEVSSDEAPVFREMLRRVATLKNGKWVRL